MRIWIDNDGCPRLCRELIWSAATRLALPVSVVGNSWMRVPPAKLFTMVVVPGSFDAADHHIAEHVTRGDLVVTADIPLASRVIEKGGTGLSPRGEVLDAENIGERLAVRNLMQELRSGGDISGGPPPLADADRKRFADALDRILTQLTRS